MKKIGIIILLIGLMSCHKGYFLNGYYRTDIDLIRVINDSIYFRSIDNAKWFPGVYEVKGNRVYITINYQDSLQDEWPRLRWSHKENAWIIRRGHLKSSFYKL